MGQQYKENGFPVLPKTLRDFFSGGEELKPSNGSIPTFKTGKLLVSKVKYFNLGFEAAIDPETLVILQKEPTQESRIFVETVNAYSLKLKVEDPA